MSYTVDLLFSSFSEEKEEKLELVLVFFSRQIPNFNKKFS